MRKNSVNLLIIMVVISIFHSITFAQENLSENYQVPPKEIADVILADKSLTLFTNKSPDGTMFLLQKNTSGLIPMRKLAEKRYNLGEFEIHPKQDRITRLTFNGTVSAMIHYLNSGKETELQLPDKDPQQGYEIVCSNFTWSPNSEYIAFFVHFSNGTELWVGETKTGKCKNLTSVKKSKILATRVTKFSWSADSRSIITVVVPFDRGKEPKPAPKKGPRIIKTEEEKAPSRTYRFLMKDPYQFALYEYYTTGQIIKVDVKNKSITRIGVPEMLFDVKPSPDGSNLLIKKISKPFSYKVPSSRFGWVEKLIDDGGAKILDTEVHEFREPGAKKNEEAEKIAVRKNYQWCADGSLIFEKDDPEKDEKGKKLKKREQYLYRLKAPYTGEADLLYSERISSRPRQPSDVGDSQWRGRDGGPKYKFSPGMTRMIVTRIRENQAQVLYVDLTKPDTVKPEVLYAYKLAEPDKYPGPVMTEKTGNGYDVILYSEDKKSIYFENAIPWNYKEDKPANYHISRFNLAEKTVTPVFTEKDNLGERVTAVLNNDFKKFIITRQSSTKVPQSVLIENGSTETILTHNTDPVKQVTQAKNIEFKYMRIDGKRADGTVYLPAGFTPGTDDPVPAMFWIYPSEFDSQKDYENRRRRPVLKNYPRLRSRSMQIMITQGYAVVIPDWPIIGPKGRINDNYVYDMKLNGEACVDKLVRMGIIDRDRLAVGGHSYGAFATANMLAHTRLFKAGIAGDGAYNRSLTPMSFQREDRYIWDARNVYIDMSPFFMANRIQGALLMYHGALDPNVGTWPVQSERMISALAGLGKTAVLYMYPYEHHGPAGKDTILDLWARWTDWLNRYVKNAVLPEEKYKKDYEKK